MESIINEHLLDFLLDNKLISKHQHGFLSKRSTCTQLVESLQDWVIALKKNMPVDITYIDFKKAFETVSHPKLIHKLKQLRNSIRTISMDSGISEKSVSMRSN